MSAIPPQPTSEKTPSDVTTGHDGEGTSTSEYHIPVSLSVTTVRSRMSSVTLTSRPAAENAFSFLVKVESSTTTFALSTFTAAAEVQVFLKIFVRLNVTSAAPAAEDTKGFSTSMAHSLKLKSEPSTVTVAPLTSSTSRAIPGPLPV